ncbi:MAG: orotate phosphoribosyltransferase [Patescibacteria group bacterium]|nr:orotate phosphoribosyltransferase [Patescibacteria group bacterium]
MEFYKESFIKFMIEAKALDFGEFTLKSGRKAPFFINTGKFQTGAQLSQLGYFYADAIANNLRSANVIFGAAYKGIPLAAAASMQLADKYSKNCYYCFNRKEAKDHGEGGLLVGYKPQTGDRIVMVDDVITAGTATKESINLLHAESPLSLIEGGVISVDRMERGANSKKSAIQEIKDEFGVNFYAIVNLDEIVSFLRNREIDGKIILNDQIFSAINTYREQYGAEY